MKRKQVTRTAIACMALSAWVGIALAQQAPGAWRCGNSYSDRPCTGGKAVALDAAPSADQTRKAERSTQRVQAAADQMARDRLRLERTAPSPLVHLPKPANAISTAEPARAAAKKKKGRKDPDFFTAAGPGMSKKKKSATADAGS